MNIEEINYKNLKNYRNIAIMGGTFDPIHFGHLVTGECVYEEFDVDKIIFMPTGKPAHKDLVTDNEHRYNMTKIAIDGNDKFEISTIELLRKGTTYTVDTIQEIREYLGEKSKIYFVMGADSVYDLYKWKDMEKLLSICQFIAVTRPNYDKTKLEKLVDELNEKYRAEIHFLEIPALDISSSELRGKIENNISVRYLLPNKVIDYIEKFKLYRGKI